MNVVEVNNCGVLWAIVGILRCNADIWHMFDKIVWHDFDSGLLVRFFLYPKRSSNPLSNFSLTS